MNEVIEKREAADVYEDLHTKLRDLNAVLDIMTTCEHDQCNVNGAAYAMQRMVEDADKLADELYQAPFRGAS
jgi:hypothetical protein